MILITGATGGLGKETIDALLEKIPASQIVALARNRDKTAELEQRGITIRIGDYTDYPSLVNAFQGIEKVLAISAAALSDRISQEKNVIDAAVEAGVSHLVFTSIQRREDRKWIIPYVTEENLVVENYLKNSGLTYTIVKNTLYFDTLPGLLGNVLQDGVNFPAGEGTAAFATRQDLGEGISALLLDNNSVSQEVTLSNSTAWSMDEVAKELSSLAGRTISYTNMDKNEYINQKLDLGFPEVVSAFMADWADATREGEFSQTPDTLEKLLGRKPTGLRSFLKETFFKD
jgi:NAD(P)H dehydrogenase (quinone)